MRKKREVVGEPFLFTTLEFTTLEFTTSEKCPGFQLWVRL